MQKFILLIFSMFLFGCSDLKYRSGRDTVKSFGNGRFQVLHARRQTKVLYDLQLQKTIAHDVKDWAVIAGNVCTFDRVNRIFIVLNVETEQFKIYKDASLAPDEFQSTLNDLLH